MATLSTNRTNPHYTSGLFPHSVVAGTTAQPDDEKAYRLSHATYQLIVSIETGIVLILRPRVIWHFMHDVLRPTNKTRRLGS